MTECIFKFEGGDERPCWGALVLYSDAFADDALHTCEGHEGYSLAKSTAMNRARYIRQATTISVADIQRAFEQFLDVSRIFEHQYVLPEKMYDRYKAAGVDMTHYIRQPNILRGYSDG